MNQSTIICFLAGAINIPFVIINVAEKNIYLLLLTLVSLIFCFFCGIKIMLRKDLKL